MQVTVPPGETALREMFRREESEGHCWLRPLLLSTNEALAEPKASVTMAVIFAHAKLMIILCLQRSIDRIAALATEALPS